MNTFFTDVIQSSPLYQSAQRVATLDLLEPTFRAKVQDIIADAAAHGVSLLVYETYRSQTRQQQLFKAGVTKLATVGVPHYLAADIVYRVGKDEPSWKGDFTFLGQFARAHQLIWGGNWGYPQRPTHSWMPTMCSGVPWASRRRCFGASGTPRRGIILMQSCEGGGLWELCKALS